MSSVPSAPDNRPRFLILVVEDDWIIGQDLACTLEEHGFEVLGPALTLTAALHLLDGRQPHAAVLDVNLGRELVTPVARHLHGCGVPFVLASGCTLADLQTDEILTTAVNLGKPTSHMRLVAVLDGLVGRNDSVTP